VHISLKKAGIFPIVHGVRSLALARRVPATGTAERIAALVEAGVLDAALGDELVQSLHFLMGLRLQAGLAQIDTGRPVTGNVDPEPQQPGARPAQGHARGGQALQGAAAPPPAAGRAVNCLERMRRGLAALPPGRPGPVCLPARTAATQ
jgi:hypothetical protein